MTDLRKAAEIALEALENSTNFIPVKTGLERDTNNAIQALRQALAQSEQEPECVATIGNWGKVQWREDVFPQLGAKLYSAPPKREWVGLTDEEIYDYADKFLYQHGSNYGIRSFGKAIEAELKEKNGG